MALTLTTWITIPLLGGVIGYVTNTIAVRMIFRPIRPVRILGIKIQGLIGRRQQDLAESIGRVVGAHLVEHKDIVRAMNKLDFHGMLTDAIDRGLAPKIEELRSLPLIGGFLTAERIESLRGKLVEGILQNEEVLLQKVEAAIEKGLDVRRMVTEKVAKFPIERIEELVLEVASRELRAIELLGGVLGVLIGLGQVAILAFTT
jgi:uncharacterized membrane protein YheB (UPF0754 family)